jgi:hypothetical protein
LLPQLASTIKIKKVKKKVVKKLSKVVKKLSKNCQNFVTPGKNPNKNNGEIVEKVNCPAKHGGGEAGAQRKDSSLRLHCYYLDQRGGTLLGSGIGHLSRFAVNQSRTRS